MKSGFWYLLLTLAFLAVTFVCVYTRKKFMKCKMKALAKIVGVDHFMSDGNSRGTYSPRYEFEVDGRVYSGNGFVSSDRRDFYKEGDYAYVFYDEANPNFFVAKEAMPSKTAEIFSAMLTAVSLLLFITTIVG